MRACVGATSLWYRISVSVSPLFNQYFGMITVHFGTAISRAVKKFR